METVDNRLAAGQNAPSSPEDWSQTSKGVRVRNLSETNYIATARVFIFNLNMFIFFSIQNSVDRRIWQHGSGLMPVFEEDEEECDCPGEEEAHVEENWHNQSQQVAQT